MVLSPTKLRKYDFVPTPFENVRKYNHCPVLSISICSFSPVNNAECWHVKFSREQCWLVNCKGVLRPISSSPVTPHFTLVIRSLGGSAFRHWHSIEACKLVGYDKIQHISRMIDINRSLKEKSLCWRMIWNRLVKETFHVRHWEVQCLTFSFSLMEHNTHSRAISPNKHCIGIQNHICKHCLYWHYVVWSKA